MVALRGFGGDLAERLGRSRSIGFEMVAEFQERGLFKKGDGGGHLGKLGAQASSADAALLFLALATEAKFKTAIARAVDYSKLPTQPTVKIYVYPWSDKIIDASNEESATIQAAIPDLKFGQHLQYIINAHRVLLVPGVELDLTGRFYAAADLISFGTGGRENEFSLNGMIQTEDMRDLGNGESARVRAQFQYFSLSDEKGDGSPMSKHSLGSANFWNGTILKECADLLGPLSPDEAMADMSVDHASRVLSADVFSKPDALETALKMARGE